jgi:hypothetical protein
MRSPLIQFCRNNPRLTLWVILAIAGACIGGIILTLMRLHALEKAQIILFGSVLLGLAPFAYQIIGDLAKRQEARKQAEKQEIASLIAEIRLDFQRVNSELRLELQSFRRDMDSRMDSLESDLANHGHRAIQDTLQRTLEIAIGNTTKLELRNEYFALQEKVRSLLENTKRSQTNDEQQ